MNQNQNIRSIGQEDVGGKYEGIELGVGRQTTISAPKTRVG
jgi:hypothetical protein